MARNRSAIGRPWLLYSYAKSLDDPATYAVNPSEDNGKTVKAWNGPTLPDTSGQQWHFVKDVWADEPNSLSFIQHFDSDEVWIAMRVPYTPGYNVLHLGAIRENGLARVAEVGRSVGGRPLLIVQVGSGNADELKHRPCILLYAGEHADEQDAMWAADGVIDFLTGPSAEASQLRGQYTFLVIPMLDPDAALAGQHAGMICGFMTSSRTPESIAYANWFQNWVNSGNRLDLIFDFHNVQSNEGPNVSCALLESLGERGELSMEIHKLVVQSLSDDNFLADPRPWMRGWSPDRLGGCLSRRYGPLCLAYEVNCQASDRHLNLHQLQGIGRSFVDAAAQFFADVGGDDLLAQVDQRRSERTARWRERGYLAAGKDAIQAEAVVSAGVGIQTPGSDSMNLLVERWLP